MNIPDPAIYASIPVIGGAIVWGARQFVLEQNRRNRQETTRDRQDVARDNAAAAVATTESPFVQLSARDWLNITAAIETHFNGRYLLAKEARDLIQGMRDQLDVQMKAMREHSDEQANRLHERISRLGREVDTKLSKLSDELKDKADKP